MKTKRLGICVICGSRVFSDENYLEASEGYCHKVCLSETAVLA